MFSKHCWAYRKAVSHRYEPGLVTVMPSGKALDTLPDVNSLQRMDAGQFQKTYCGDCDSSDCEVNKKLNAGLLTTIFADEADEIGESVEFFDTPEGQAEIVKVVGTIQNDGFDLYCQGLVINLNGNFCSLLYCDGRLIQGKFDLGVPDEFKIKMNIDGEIIDYGYLSYSMVPDTETLMIALNLGNVSEEEAINRTKVAFKRIAEQINLV